MVVTQLAERSLLTSQIGGSNPSIGDKVFSNVLIRQLQWRKDKNKEKEAVVGPFKKKLRCEPKPTWTRCSSILHLLPVEPTGNKTIFQKRRFFSQFQCFWLYLNFIGFRLGLSERGIRFEKEREGIFFFKSFILFFHLHKTCFHAQLSIILIVYANEKIKCYSLSFLLFFSCLSQF